MLCRIHDIYGYSLRAEDGEIGRAKDILFDDRAWVVRYLVVNTHKWLPGGRKVVVSPVSLAAPNNEAKTIPVKLTLEDIETGPDLDEHKPVSRKYEINLFNHLGYGYYWMGSGLWGPHPTPMDLATEPPTAPPIKLKDVEEGHLRSTQEVDHYHIKTLEGKKGNVTEFILDTDDWSIPYVVIDTHSWVPLSKKVVAPTHIFSEVSWVNRSVAVNLTTDQIANAPEFHFDQLNKEEYQKSLLGYYNNLLFEEKGVAAQG